VHADVEPEAFEQFEAAESKGQFFNENIRDAYGCAEAAKGRHRRMG
jgi:hypothetical protein